MVSRFAFQYRVNEDEHQFQLIILRSLDVQSVDRPHPRSANRRANEKASLRRDSRPQVIIVAEETDIARTQKHRRGIALLIRMTPSSYRK